MDMLLRMNKSDERQRYPHVDHEDAFLALGGKRSIRAMELGKAFFIDFT
jgi:hypothetical protein